VINKMHKIKIVISLVAVAALTLVAVGLASAQIAANQTYTGTNPNTAAPFNGFFNWIGNCFGYRTNQAYSGQHVEPQAPTDGSVPAPAPYQGSYNYGYGYGYGYGPCWAR
jgi:hypothetical protein